MLQPTLLLAEANHGPLGECGDREPEDSESELRLPVSKAATKRASVIVAGKAPRSATQEM
jgi:hypothetical protein